MWFRHQHRHQRRQELKIRQVTIIISSSSIIINRGLLLFLEIRAEELGHNLI